MGKAKREYAKPLSWWRLMVVPAWDALEMHPASDCRRDGERPGPREILAQPDIVLAMIVMNDGGTHFRPDPTFFSGGTPPGRRDLVVDGVRFFSDTGANELGPDRPRSMTGPYLPHLTYGVARMPIDQEMELP